MKLPFKINKSIFRLRRRYTLSMVNENSLRPVISISLRKSRILIILGALILASGIFWYLLFRFTPMRRLLPLRLDTTMRDRYVALTVKLDSLSDIVALNTQYATNIAALLGDSLDLATENDTTGINLYDLPLDSLMQAGNAEKRFVEQFESSERFKLSVLSPIAAEGMVFYPPVNGVSLKSNAADGDIPAVNVWATSTTPVSAAYKGAVVDAYYAADRGVTVVIQHPNNFITQYSGLGNVFVTRGDKVNAGQRIGMAAESNYPLTFMLWHDGSALNPGDYIELPTTDQNKESEPFIATKVR